VDLCCFYEDDCDNQLGLEFFSTMNIRSFLITSCLTLSFFGDLFAQADPTSCFDLQDRGRSLKNQHKYQESYDTLKRFIDSCATQSFAPITFVMQSANASSLSETNRDFWVEHREWLKKVLYYSSDTNYYCYDADAIITSFVYFPGRGYDQNGALAVTKYLLESGKCPELEETKWYQENYR
jgi:hypothetical protein